MSTLTIRNIEPDIKSKLRVVAAAHGHSMEEEVRSILRAVLAQPAASRGMGSRIHAQFAALGGVELVQRVRSDMPRAIGFDESAAK